VPLNVIIAVNEEPIQHIRISRLDHLNAPEDMYPYMVQSNGVAAVFAHRYNEGAEECLRRALEALANERERQTRDSSR
jgi:hypothetical protein